MIHLARFLILFLMTTIAQAQDEGSTVEVKILHIDNEKGQMLIGLYDSEASWLKKPTKGMFAKITDGKSEVKFTNIPDGTYAISSFHDEDNDGELDTIFGITT
jgi:uncharacterized protein (DUF2141 family)